MTSILRTLTTSLPLILLLVQSVSTAAVSYKKDFDPFPKEKPYIASRILKQHGHVPTYSVAGGVGALHAQGLNGTGINIALIGHSINIRHPNFAHSIKANYRFIRDDATGNAAMKAASDGYT